MDAFRVTTERDNSFEAVRNLRKRVCWLYEKKEGEVESLSIRAFLRLGESLTLAYVMYLCIASWVLETYLYQMGTSSNFLVYLPHNPIWSQYDIICRENNFCRGHITSEHLWTKFYSSVWNRIYWHSATSHQKI